MNRLLWKTSAWSASDWKLCQVTSFLFIPLWCNSGALSLKMQLTVPRRKAVLLMAVILVAA